MGFGYRKTYKQACCKTLIDKLQRKYFGIKIIVYLQPILNVDTCGCGVIGSRARLRI